MSMYPVLWAIDHAPVYDAEERAVLVALVVKGDFDGMNCFRSYPTLAAAARVDAKTAGRKCRAMESRGILRRQTAHQSRVWLSIPKEQRPVIWEVMIPAEWWSAAQLESINEQRAGLGRPLLTPANRPALAPAPLKKARADKGVQRPKKADPGTTSPRVKTDITAGGVGTTSPYPPDYKSLPPGLQVPQPSESPSESPSEKPNDSSRPSVREAEVARASGSGTEGRTDGGGGVIEDQEQEPVRAGGPGGEAAASEGGVTGDATPAAGSVVLTPGAEVLRAIAAEAPQWTLTWDALRDQGLAVSGMLLEGFTAQEVRHALLSRPLPQPLTHTVGAVVSRRLKDLIKVGPAAGARPIPEQHRADEWTPGGYGSRGGSGDVTPTPPAWGARHAELEAANAGRSALRNCTGDDGLCDRLAVIGEDQCGEHLGWERCPQCATRYRRPGNEACDRCQDAGSMFGTEAHTAPAPF
ncbi:hypothetical protein OHB41_51320 [Streptomyces sp. NBC_01571]|uniref:hypothetical protein n=1 Tax=Streptomyces sp. NBC_01571 TaxID=2975883 RepID=UPI00225835C4|nr:hypothetical protein [Streptomyces sp. NBC_01571]MCX4581350.1 hypothetical protein [Streptomyces sp. NBC_01571]